MNIDYEYIVTKLMLIIFKVLGLAPFAEQTSPGSKSSKKGAWQNFTPIPFSPSRLGCFYNLILITVQCGILYVAIPRIYTKDYPLKTPLTVTIVLFVSVFGNFTLFTIYLILGFRQKTIVRLLNRLLSVDYTSISRNGNHTCASSRNLFLLIFLTNIVVLTGLEWTRVLAYDLPLIAFFRIDCPIVIITLFTIQYNFMIRLIYNRLRTINRALLEHYVTLSSNHTLRLSIASELSLNYSLRPKIMTLRRVHASLYEIASEVAEFYSLPILFVIAHLCCLFIYSAHYVIILCITPHKTDMKMIIANLVIFSIASLLPIVVLAFGITSFTAEVYKLLFEMKRTVDIVDKLRICSKINGDDKIELKQFALELMHRKVRFTACGLFSLDCTLVHSILSMGTTYLIILLQHQMGRITESTQHQIHNTTNVESNPTGYNGN